MKVLIIPTWYPIGTNDKLMGIYHKEFTNALINNENIDADILYIDRQMIKHPFKYLAMKKSLVIDEGKYNAYVRKILDVSKINYDLEIKNYTKALEKEFKEYVKQNGRPDVIHAMVSIPAGYAACKLGNKYNIPVVVTEHASYFERFFKGQNEKYGKYVLENSYFTTVSKYMSESIKKLGYASEVLSNLVDVDSFKKKRRSVKGLRLVTVCALRKLKRIDDIIEALKIIVEEKNIHDAKLTVVGDGFEEEYFKNRCTELGMDKYVEFVGRKTKDEIADILNNSNIYVLASEIETFGIPIIEAYAAGLPVIATRCNGPEEFVNEKTGKLIEIGNIKELANTILDVYNNLDKYKKEDLIKAAEEYSDKNIAKKTVNIYKSLLNNKN